MTAVSSRDYSVVMGLTVLALVVIILANLVVDLAYLVIDPRIRRGR